MVRLSTTLERFGGLATVDPMRAGRRARAGRLRRSCRGYPHRTADTSFVDELVVGGLPFPAAVAFTPPDGKMLVALSNGEVCIYQGATPVGTFVDIEDRVHDNHGRGVVRART